MRRGRLVAIGAALVALAGCLHPKGTHPAAANLEVRIRNVPFYPAGPGDDGPSAVAALLSFWGRSANLGDLRRQLVRPEVKGVLPTDVSPVVDARGLASTVSVGSLGDLRMALRAGHPALVFVDDGGPLLPPGRFAVITGFDDGGVYANVGPDRDRYFPSADFDRAWARANRWMLVVTGPAKNLP